MLAVLLKSLRDRYDSPSDLLAALEAGLGGFLRPGVFITIFYGILDPADNRLTFASAAHSPLLVYRAARGEVESHRTRGIPLGAVKGGMLRSTLEDTSVVLGQGDVALQYTDGLNEAPHRECGEELGFARVEALLAGNAPHGHKTLLRRLRKSVADWSGRASRHDDLTLLVISCEGSISGADADGDEGLARELECAGDDAAVAALLDESTRLDLPARLESLDPLSVWLRGRDGLAGLDEETLLLLDGALRELCGNIIEHGYADRDGNAGIDIWWQEGCGAASSTSDALPACGCLVVRDRGRVYDHSDWRPPDLHDETVRRRGRGLGRLMMEKILDEIVYLPATPTGNYNLIRLGPVASRRLEV